LLFLHLFLGFDLLSGLADVLNFFLIVIDADKDGFFCFDLLAPGSL
jgi:hypothetical protein